MKEKPTTSEIAENSVQITLSVGISQEYRQRAAHLYDMAFGEKLALAIPNPDERLKLLSKAMQLDYAVGAFDSTKLIGIAGFSTARGSLTGGIDYRGLLSELGWMKGNRAAVVLSLYERKARYEELLMDGIVVDPEYRGRGVGGQLFSKLVTYAESENYLTIRLDVIDTNSGARRLYERLGFCEEKTETFEFLRSILGFGASTTMILTL
ncbi:MAG: N-acetyltransferase family protein [Granulosicoccus sp.]